MGSVPMKRAVRKKFVTPHYGETDILMKRDACIDHFLEFVTERAAYALRLTLPPDLARAIHPSWSPLVLEWRHAAEDRIKVDVSLGSDLASQAINLQDAKMIFREVYHEASAKVPMLFGDEYRALVKKRQTSIDTRDMSEEDFLRLMKKRKNG